MTTKTPIVPKPTGREPHRRPPETEPERRGEGELDGGDRDLPAEKSSQEERDVDLLDSDQ